MLVSLLASRLLSLPTAKAVVGWLAGCDDARAVPSDRAARGLAGEAVPCVLLQSPLHLRLRLLGCPSWGLPLPMQLRLLPLVP